MFKVGDRVKIKKECDLYSLEDPTNPHNLIGKIIKIDAYGYLYKVQWGPYLYNFYAEEHLVHVDLEIFGELGD